MYLDACHHVARLAQLALAGARACSWGGYGYWFSRGAPVGPVEMT